MNQDLKRHLKSALLTFIAVFLSVILFNIGTLSFTQDALISVGLTAIRAAIKATLEYLIPYLKGLIIKNDNNV